MRYIHLNSLKAGLVKDIKALNGCRFTGHSCLMGKRVNDLQAVLAEVQEAMHRHHALGARMLDSVSWWQQDLVSCLLSLLTLSIQQKTHHPESTGVDLLSSGIGYGHVDDRDSRETKHSCVHSQCRCKEWMNVG